METILVKDAEGKFVELTVDGRTLKVGDRVRRGPDWAWNDQDQGHAGTITTIIRSKWATVTWDHGKKNDYRWGDDGKFDLRVVTEKPEPKSEDVEWAGHTWKLNAVDGDLNLIKDGDAFLWLKDAGNGRAKLRLMGPAKVDL